MINVIVERRYGTASVRSRVTAPSIERAVQLAGEGASIVFPIDPHAFFGATDAPENVETLRDPGGTELTESAA